MWKRLRPVQAHKRFSLSVVSLNINPRGIFPQQPTLCLLACWFVILMAPLQRPCVGVRKEPVARCKVSGHTADSPVSPRSIAKIRSPTYTANLCFFFFNSAIVLHNVDLREESRKDHLFLRSWILMSPIPRHLPHCSERPRCHFLLWVASLRSTAKQKACPSFIQSVDMLTVPLRSRCF